MLEVRGLAKSWPGFGLSLGLSLGRGEIAAVLGPSGCGKSTLLRLIAGLERPDAGEIVMDGRDISGLPPERRAVGMVFQDFALFPHLSVRRNIEYGPKMRRTGRAERRAEAEALAESFEISSLLERSPYSLSGGEQQRVALARTLAAKPAIVLLDEPLSSLDASLRRRLRSEIVERLRGAGISAMLVTHDAEEALAVADRIFLMREGRIETQGLPEELYAAPPTAWSASFLGRGPLVEILSLEKLGNAHIARTPLGEFRCVPWGETAAGASARSFGLSSALFFPSESPRMSSPGEKAYGPANRIAGRVASSSFSGRFRRVALSCPIVTGSARGGSIVLELELPTSIRAEPGDTLELEIPEDRCFALPVR
jgi:ABC-type Fe3+/spermidine/putrescine transport system ATPase subunit